MTNENDIVGQTWAEYAKIKNTFQMNIPHTKEKERYNQCIPLVTIYYE